MSSTTIKVSTELRDRLAARASACGTTMAGVISAALDESEEREFWARVRDDHARLADDARAASLADPTASDDLDDPSDGALPEDAW
jgi:predicted transcriptional regulator